MAQTKEYRQKLGKAKSEAANKRELIHQGTVAYKAMVANLPHKKAKNK